MQVLGLVRVSFRVFVRVRIRIRVSVRIPISFSVSPLETTAYNYKLQLLVHGRCQASWVLADC